MNARVAGRALWPGLAWLALASCAHGPSGAPEAHADEVWRDLEDGFAALRAGAHVKARARLAHAVARFDELALDGGPLPHALASDPRKPYRGRVHERVLASLTLAALDAEAGRCDMARPSIRNARYLAAPLGDAPLPLADALERACVEALPLTLTLEGDGPRLRRTGEHGSELTVDPGDPAGPAGRIVIGAERPVGPVVWSSTQAALRARARPFAATLAARAQHKREAEQFAHREGQAGWDALLRSARDGSLGGEREEVVTSILRLGAAATAQGASAVVDARADDRFVESLPERVRISALP